MKFSAFVDSFIISLFFARSSRF